MSTESTSKPSTPYTPRPAGGGYAPRTPGRYPSSGPAGASGSFGKGMRRPPIKKRSCRVCEERKGHVDWKAVNYLRGFVTDRGKMLAGRSKGTCAPCQRNLARAIKRARNMALLPTSPV